MCKVLIKGFLVDKSNSEKAIGSYVIVNKLRKKEHPVGSYYVTFTVLSTNGLQKLFDAQLSMFFHNFSMDVVPHHTVWTPPPSLRQTVDCAHVVERYLQNA